MNEKAILELEIGNNLVVDERAREWCKCKYPNHPKGCPNYNHKLTCPPQAPLLSNYFNLDRSLKLLALEFNLGEHARNMKAKYPNWTDRQARCLLYWQPKQRRILENYITTRLNFNYNSFTTCPEAMGGNVIKTARNLGIPITARPVGTVYLIAFLGSKGVD